VIGSMHQSQQQETQLLFKRIAEKPSDSHDEEFARAPFGLETRTPHVPETASKAY